MKRGHPRNSRHSVRCTLRSLPIRNLAQGSGRLVQATHKTNFKCNNQRYASKRPSPSSPYSPQGPAWEAVDCNPLSQGKNSNLHRFLITLFYRFSFRCSTALCCCGSHPLMATATGRFRKSVSWHIASDCDGLHILHK